MTRRLFALIVSLPALLALSEAVSFHARNRNNGSIVVDGVKREYVLHVPRSYDRAKSTPLVISMHGAGGWPVQQMNLSGWNALADREGFIVVYPSGLSAAGPRVWRVERGEGLAKDVAFISALIDKIEASYNIDRTRVYANGISNGGGMSFVLSCRLTQRIAAVGLVASAQTLPWSWCADRHSIPMIAFHGTADPMVPYVGGRTWISPQPFPSILTWTTNWAKRNRCSPDFTESAAARDVTRREYHDCDADVVLYTIRGGGHTWPGGEPMPEWFVGPTSREIDATNVMWEFFRAHPQRTTS